MGALPPKERQFVLLLFEGKSGAQAAREAGYGRPDSTAGTMARIALRTRSRDRVILAIQEMQKKLIRSHGATAVRTVVDIMNNTTHKDQLKAANLILARTDPEIVKTETQVTVEHKLNAHDRLELRALLIEMGADPAMVDAHPLLRIEDRSKIVDVEFTELPSIDMCAPVNTAKARPDEEDASQW
jgi:phage terminase small subunit